MKTLRPRNWPSSVGAGLAAEGEAGDGSTGVWVVLMIDSLKKEMKNFVF
jgi:hypothetical protein